MKKRIILLIIILFLPVMVEAKEYCTIVSGNGKNIGSEIACGSEHFYVIDSSGENIKMLSKYNLYVGANYNKIMLDENIFTMSKCQNDECYYDTTYYFGGEQVGSSELWESKVKEKYNIDEIVDNETILYNDDGKYAILSYGKSDKYTIDGVTYQNTYYKLYPFTHINENTNGYALQNKLALGVTGEKGNANYPIYATLILMNGFDINGNFYHGDVMGNFDNFKNGYTNFDFIDSNNIPVKKYLNDYKSNLNNGGFNVQKVDLISIKELDDLVYSITNKNLPLERWYNDSLNSDVIVEDGAEFYNLGDLKEFLSNDYSWLWTSSYWTKTLAGNYSSYDLHRDLNSNAYFISSSGEICYGDSGCYSGIPRAGLRPVVTISKDSIKYNIKTKTDGKGTIEVVDSAYGGEEIRFRVTAKKEYKLVGLTITTDSGEVVEFNEEDIISNNDGTMSISTNKFTMPYDNVLIQARWASSIVNPSTGIKIGFTLFMLFIIDISIIYVIAIRKRQVE